MLVKNLDIKDVKATNFNHQHRKITLHVTFTNDTPLTRDVVLQRNTESIANDLLKWIKQQKKPDADPYEDVLSGVIILNIAGDMEDIRDKIAQGLSKIYQRLNNVNNISTAREYMTLFNQLKTAQEIVYQKRADY